MNIKSSYNVLFEKGFALLALIIGIYITCIQVMGTGLEKIPGDFGDARFNNYILEHCYQFFTGQVDHFWDGRFMYPETDVISYSDNLLGTAPIYALFRLFHFSNATSFQLWIIVLITLNYFCALWVFYKWSNSLLIATIGAYIFAFNLAFFGQMHHAQCFPRFMIPLAIYWLIRFFKTYHFKYLWLTAFALLLEIYAGIYLGFFLLLTLTILGIVSIVIYRESLLLNFKSSKQKSFFMIAGCMVVNALLLLPIMIPYISRVKINGMRSFGELASTIPNLKCYITPYLYSTFWNSIFNFEHLEDHWWDQLLFPGGIALMGLFAVIAISIRKNKNDKSLELALLFTFCLLFLFTSKIGNFTLYPIIYKLIPGFKSIRVVSRIINIEIFIMAAFVVLACNRIVFKNRLASLFFYSLLLIVSIADNYADGKKVMTYSKLESELRVNLLVQKARHFDLNSYQVIAFIAPENTQTIAYFHLDAMLACQQLMKRSVNGYTAMAPTGFYFFDSANEANLFSWMQQHKVPDKSILIVK